MERDGGGGEEEEEEEEESSWKILQMIGNYTYYCVIIVGNLKMMTETSSEMKSNTHRILKDDKSSVGRLVGW